MPRIVRGGLIQATLCEPATSPVEKIKKAMIDKHVAMIDAGGQEGRRGHLPAGAVLRAVLLRRAGDQVVQPHGADSRGPDDEAHEDLAKKHKMVIVVPMYEEDLPGVYYNSAAVIDADGEYLGKFRKIHIPHCNPGFWEKFYFRPGNLGYPVFDTKIGKVGVYICYDRHFPDGARCLGLNGAEIVFNPSATVAGLSEYLWKLEQPAHAVANQYFVGAINRPGWEEPWRHRRILRPELLRRSARPVHRPEREADGRRHRRRRHGLRHDPRSPQRLAILPRPPAGNVRGDHGAVIDCRIRITATCTEPVSIAAHAPTMPPSTLPAITSPTKW